MTSTPVNPASLTGTFRPSPKLLKLYLLHALVTTVAFPFVFLPLYFRFKTLTYRFDAEGISASWGILFRKEVFLTYRRIQDIHVTAGILQRWLGIGTVEIQTASGSSGAELSIEGMENFVAIRDFLYSKMRGATEEGAHTATTAAPASPLAAHGAGTPVEQVLTQIRDDLREVRRALEARP